MAKVRRVPGPAADRFKVAMAELAKDKVVKVGWFESAVYEDSTPVAYVAAIQEFGTHRAGPQKGMTIPPRPFFRPTIAKEKNEWKSLVKMMVKRILKGESSAYDAMDALGGKAAGDVAKTISQLKEPALSPVTVMLRGMKKNGEEITGKSIAKAVKRVDEGKTNYGASTKPLVDSGYMISTLTHAVEDN